MKTLNSEGPEVIGHLPVVPALPPAKFKEAIEAKSAVLIDSRLMLAFGGGHIKGALNIWATPMLPIWAGWLLDPAEPILIVLDSDTAVENVAALFLRSGYTKFAGYLERMGQCRVLPR